MAKETCTTRQETDSLGSVDIDNTHYWGIHTARAIDNFPISNTPVPPVFIKALAMVKLAAARVNQQLGYLDESIYNSISYACEEIMAGKYSQEFPLDEFQGGAGTSTNMNINEVIANIALEHQGYAKGEYQHICPLAHVNLHQSTNDVYPTATRLACLSLLEDLQGQISSLQEATQAKEKEFHHIIKLARTQLQDALPYTLGMQFAAWSDAFARDRWRVFKCKERLKTVNLGGTAIGTGLGAPRTYILKVVQELRRISGLGIARAENLIDATQNQDSLVEVSAILKTYASNLLKICTDIRLMASGPHAGLAEVTLKALQAGSSIMPTKVNPVIPEAISQVAMQVIANDSLITDAVSRSSLELCQFMPLVSSRLIQTISLLINATIIIRDKCIVSISANVDTCASYVKKCDSIVTVLVPHLGYAAVEKIVKNAQKQNISVYKAAADSGFINPQHLADIFKAEKMYKLGFTDDNNLQ